VSAEHLPTVVDEGLTDEQLVEMAGGYLGYGAEAAANRLLQEVDGVTLDEAKTFVIRALEKKLEVEQAYADENSKIAGDAVDKAKELEAENNRLFIENIATKQRKRMPVSEEEIQMQARLIKAQQARVERELLPDLDSIKSEYPEFPNWVMEGTSFYENHVKPICDANPGARIPHFNFIPGVVMMLNYIGNKVRIPLRNWKPSLYVVIIGKKGKVKKSSSINDAMAYFHHVGVADHYSNSMKNADGKTVVWEAGSPEGLGTNMQNTNCKNAVLFYDELSVLAKKANIESSTMRDSLLKMYESGMFSNSIKSKKDSFAITPGSYVASLIAASTKKKFAETYSSLGSGDDGLDDRFSFHLQPEVLERSRPQVWVSTIEGAIRTRQLIDQAVNQQVFEFDKDALELLEQAQANGLNDRDEIRAEKYALYFTVDLGRQRIDLDCVQRGLAVVRYEVAVKKYLRLTEADGKQAQLQIKIRRLLEDAPDGMMTERELERKANAHRHGTFNWSNAVKGLLISGVIREVQGLGRKGATYQLMKLIETDEDDE
jgi:hypothetical protein